MHQGRCIGAETLAASHSLIANAFVSAVVIERKDGHWCGRLSPELLIIYDSV